MLKTNEIVYKLSTNEQKNVCGKCWNVYKPKEMLCIMHNTFCYSCCNILGAEILKLARQIENEKYLE